MNKIASILLIIGVMSIWFFIIVFGRAVFGATEAQCTIYSGNELIMIANVKTDNGKYSNEYEQNYACAWLVDKIMSNGSGFDLKEFVDGSYTEPTWVLTK